MNSKRSKGVTIFGVVLIVSSLYHISALLNFAHYKYLFQSLPEGVILFRFFVSWALRIAGLITGVGILCLKNGFRKVAIYLFVLTILTVAWKHPYAGFQNHAAYLDQLFKNYGIYAIELGGVRVPSFSSLARVSAMGARILDILFGVIFIYYFTRPKVKEQFRAEGPAEAYGLLEDFLAKKRAQAADKFIPRRLREGRILDIGCGTTPFFLFHTEFKYKTGLDTAINPSLLKNDIIFQEFDLEKDARLPFPDGSFDVITMLAVFEHIKPDKLRGVLKEIRRILKPGGRFILTTPCPRARILLRFMASLGLVNSHKMNQHKGAYGKGLLFQYFLEAGFVREKTFFGYFELFLNSWAYADK